MSDCRRILERLTPYTDKALAADERAEMEQHLDACPPCRTAALQAEGGRTVLRTCAERLKAESVPPGLRSRCEALTRRRTRARGWVARLVPATLTAVLLLLAAAALFSLATHQSSTLLAAQLTLDHSKCFRLFAGEDARPVEAPAVERLLEERHGWDIHVPPSNPEAGIELIGARRCLYADGRIPHVMYRAKGQDVSLYILEGVSREDANVLTLGHRSLIWTRGATTYVLVHDQDAAGMRAVEEYVVQRVQGVQ